MTCYICDLERVTPAAQAMTDDEWNEGCIDCEREFWQWVASVSCPTDSDRAVSDGS